MYKKNLWQETRGRLFKGNNSLGHLITVNILVFVFFGLLKVIFVLGSSSQESTLNMHAWYNKFWNYFSLSASAETAFSRPWTFITYMFMHSNSGIFHILWNMLILYWFGRIFQDFLNNRKLLTLYFYGGIAGGLIFLIAFQIFPYFDGREPLLGMVGASASVLAILVASATLVPDYQVFLLFIGRIPLKYIAVFLVVIDVLSLTGDNAGGHFAHLGGALCGFFYIRLLKNGYDTGIWIDRVRVWLKNRFRPAHQRYSGYQNIRYKEFKEEKPKRKEVSVSRRQEEIDEILDKIAQSGYDSLTDKEKENLFNASKK
jgi:membrane associated rhomboid family serine protease